MTTPLHISNHVEEKSDDYKHCKHNNKIKIATILPYKENYTHGGAGAVSLWVSSFLKYSKNIKQN